MWHPPPCLASSPDLHAAWRICEPASNSPSKEQHKQADHRVNTITLGTSSNVYNIIIINVLLKTLLSMWLLHTAFSAMRVLSCLAATILSLCLAAWMNAGVSSLEGGRDREEGREGEEGERERKELEGIMGKSDRRRA